MHVTSTWDNVRIVLPFLNLGITCGVIRQFHVPAASSSRNSLRCSLNWKVFGLYKLSGHSGEYNNSPPLQRIEIRFLSRPWSIEWTLWNNNVTKCLGHEFGRGRSQWPSGLRRGSVNDRLLGLWVRIPPGAWVFVCCKCCVLSGRALCKGLITRPEESCRLWWVLVCDQV
jgi:hypothetical protein